MKNISPILYAAAATVWLVQGFLSFKIVYFILAVVFYVLAIKNRKLKG